jgi:hypothetical protein
MAQLVSQLTLAFQPVTAATGMVQAMAAATKLTLNGENVMRLAETGQTATGHTVAGTAAAAAAVSMRRLDMASGGRTAKGPDTVQRTRSSQTADLALIVAWQVLLAAGRLFRSGQRLCSAGREAAAHCGAAGDQPRPPSRGASAVGVAAAAAAAAAAAQPGTVSGTTMDLAQPSNSVNGRLPSKTLRQQQRHQHQLATPLTSCAQ